MVFAGLEAEKRQISKGGQNGSVVTMWSPRPKPRCLGSHRNRKYAIYVNVFFGERGGNRTHDPLIKSKHNLSDTIRHATSGPDKTLAILRSFSLSPLTRGDKTRTNRPPDGSATGPQEVHEADEAHSTQIELLECPEGKKDALVFDDEQRGLGVRVTASGARVYLAQYALAGCQAPHSPRLMRRNLSSRGARSDEGHHGRRRQRPRPSSRSQGGGAQGGSQGGARRAHPRGAARTMGRIASCRQARALPGRSRPRHQARLRLKPKVASRRSQPLAVVRVLDGLARDGKPAMASRTAAYGRAAYHWAVKRGSLAVNPFANLPQAPLARRERVLTDEELRAVWRATGEPGPFNAIVRMLILTGQRREEAGWHDLGRARR